MADAPNTEGFSRRLRATRDAVGLRRAEVYSRLGVAKSTYSLWENGGRTPSHDHLEPLCDLLGVTADWLLFGRVAGLPHGLVLKLRERGEEK